MSEKTLRKLENSLRMYKKIPKLDDTMLTFSLLMSEYLAMNEIPDHLHQLIEEVDEKNAWLQCPGMTLVETVSRKLLLDKALDNALKEVNRLLNGKE